MSSNLIKSFLLIAVVFVLSCDNQVSCKRGDLDSAAIESGQEMETIADTNKGALLKFVMNAYSRVLAENVKLRQEYAQLSQAIEYISEGLYLFDFLKLKLRLYEEIVVLLSQKIFYNLVVKI